MGRTLRSVAIVAVVAAAALSGPSAASAAPSRPPSGFLPPVPSTHRTAAGGCVVDGGTQGFPIGRAKLEIRSRPVGAAAVWLPGLNSTACEAVLTQGGTALARRLAADVARAPYIPPGTYSCPMSDGTSVRVSFIFLTGSSQTVGIALNGCAGITSRACRARALTAALRRDLSAIAPPAWRSYLATT